MSAPERTDVGLVMAEIERIAADATDRRQARARDALDRIYRADMRALPGISPVGPSRGLERHRTFGGLALHSDAEYDGWDDNRLSR